MKKHFVPACQKAKFLLTDSNRSDNPDGTVPQLQVMHHKDTQEIYFVKKHFVPACQKAKFLLTDSNRSDNPDGTVPQLQVMYC